MKKNFIINCQVYPFDVMFSIGQTDQELFDVLKDAGLVTEMDGSSKWKSQKQLGYAIQFIGGQSLVRLRGIPKTPEEHGALAHEILHSAQFILDFVGIKFHIDYSDEAYTYLVQFITQKFHENILKK